MELEKKIFFFFWIWNNLHNIFIKKGKIKKSWRYYIYYFSYAYSKKKKKIELILIYILQNIKKNHRKSNSWYAI